MQEITAAIIIRDKRIFITHRAPGEKHAGKWKFQVEK